MFQDRRCCKCSKTIPATETRTIQKTGEVRQYTVCRSCREKYRNRQFMTCAQCDKVFDRLKWDVPIKYCSLTCAYWSGVDIEKKGCWPWKRKKCTKGFGVVKWRGKLVAAHRAGYAAMHGKPDLDCFGTIWNMCGNRACARGDHWTEDSAWKWVYSERYKS